VTAGLWLKLVRNSTLAAALVTAAQFGIGSGVGIIDWQPSLASPTGWRALLTWVIFMYAVGVVAGATVGQRFVPARLRPLRPFVRGTAALAAGFGAALAFPMVWVPVSVVHTAANPSPEFTVVVAAGGGIVLGLIAASFALTWGAVTAGAALTAAWVWVLALASAMLSALNHAAVTPGLGLLDAPAAIPPSTWWSGPFLMVGLAAVCGLFVAAVSGWRGSTWLGVALSGVVGPALIVAAYLTTGWAMAMAGMTESSGATAPVVAALVAAAVGLIVSAAVAAPQQRRNRVDVFSGTPVPRQTRPAAIEPRRPLAITASAERPYELEAGPTGSTFLTEPIYLAPQRSYPSAPEPSRKGKRAAPVYSSDPYSSEAFEVSSTAFDTVRSSPPAPSRSSRSAASSQPATSSRPATPSRPAATSPPPSPAPAPPSPARPTPKGPAVPPSPARPPAPGFAPSSAQPASAYPGGADLNVPTGLFTPAPAPPVPSAPASKPAYVEPSKLLEQGYAPPAGPAEPGFDERVYHMPPPGSKATPRPLNAEPKKAKPKGRAAASAAPAAPATPIPAPVVPPPAPSKSSRRSAEPAPSAPPVAARASAPVSAEVPATSEPTLRVLPTSPPGRSPVADPAPTTSTARPAPAAGPVPTQPTTRRARQAARAAAKAAAAAAVPEPVPSSSALRASAIEGEVVSESTSPTSGGPASRRGRKDRPLRKGEREHIDWVTNLVQIEPDAVLKTSKER
jgi:hypothetical protein